MKLITEVEARQLCDATGALDLRAGRPHLRSKDHYVVELQLPKSARRCVVFCRGLLRRFGDESSFHGGLLWLLDYEIGSPGLNAVGWKTCELMRKGFGELRPIETAAAHMFRSDEIVEMTAMLLLPIMYQWEALFVPASPEYLFWLNEDIGYLAMKSEADFKESFTHMEEYARPSPKRLSGEGDVKTPI